MNIIATCAIGVFFNFLYMSPIYAHSPHFRTLYKRFSCTHSTITVFSYFAGVNVMRMLTSNMMGLRTLKSDLDLWKFYVVPLNNMANMTVIFSVIQMSLNIWCVATYLISENAFALSAFGILMNLLMAMLQFWKHLKTRAFLVRYGDQPRIGI